MKNLLKNIVIYLKRKHYINNLALIGIFILLIINVALVVLNKVNKHRYIYVDMYGSTGASEKCYYNEGSRDYRCMIPVKVQQYVEEK